MARLTLALDMLADVPQSTDHYMEPAQHEVQDVLSISTEVHVFHHARLEKDHARLEKDHARLDLDHEVSQNDRDFSLLARLARSACTNDRADDLSTLFDPIMDFSFGNFSKARILKLSEDLGFVGTQLVRSERPAALADRPAYLLILTALDLAVPEVPFAFSDHIQHPAKVILPILGFFKWRSSKEKPPRQSISQTPFKYSLNNFDEFVSVQEQPDIWRKTTRDVADPKRRLLQFDVQEFCDNFVEEVVKTLKDVNQIPKKSTSTRAPVAEPSLFISKKSKGKSETHVEELKDFSDYLPIYDEYDEEPIESLMIYEKNCDFPSSEYERIIDNEQPIGELTVLQPEHPSSLVLSPQVFEEEPLDYPHQGPRLDSRKPLDEDLGPIFDEEDEPGPVFDAETTSIISIVMESHLCFDPATTHIPLTPDLQEHLFVLSIQEIQVQPLRNDSINRVQQLEIWRSFVVQPGYLGNASDRGSVKNGYLNILDVFCHELNFHGEPTHQGFTKAWNHLKRFTEEGVMNFPNQRFSSPSIREYQTSKGDSGPRKKRPEPKPILNEPKVFPHSTSCPNQKHFWPDFEIDKPIFGNHFTCFILAHVLDDYPKGLDPDFDVLRIEKPFDYFFHRFDVVSLVILNEQDKHDQFPRRASTGECLRTCVRGTWNRTCLRETISNLQGSFCTMDLRTNPFEEGGNDVPQSTDHYMEQAQHEVQDVLSISTEEKLE
ncbi:hypothetical protein YC2023_040518 [Brassica napus]